MLILCREYKDTSNLLIGRNFSSWTCRDIFIALHERLKLYWALIKDFVWWTLKLEAFNYLVNALQKGVSIEYLDGVHLDGYQKNQKKVMFYLNKLAKSLDRYICERSRGINQDELFRRSMNKKSRMSSDLCEYKIDQNVVCVSWQKQIQSYRFRGCISTNLIWNSPSRRKEYYPITFWPWALRLEKKARNHFSVSWLSTWAVSYVKTESSLGEKYKS